MRQRFPAGAAGIALARDAPVAVGGAGNAATGDKDAGASWWTIVRTAPAIIAGAALFAAFDNIILSFLRSSPWITE